MRTCILCKPASGNLESLHQAAYRPLKRKHQGAQDCLISHLISCSAPSTFAPSPLHKHVLAHPHIQPCANLLIRSCSALLAASLAACPALPHGLGPAALSWPPQELPAQRYLISCSAWCTHPPSHVIIHTHIHMCAQHLLDLVLQ